MESIVDRLVFLLENDLAAVARILICLLIVSFLQWIWNMMLLGRVHRLEKLLKQSWPMKFVGKF